MRRSTYSVPCASHCCNILTNSCIFKKINKEDYISSIQLDAIQHLIMIKNSAKTKDSSNYEDVKNRIIRLFKSKYSEFCQDFNTFNTTNKKKISTYFFCFS